MSRDIKSILALEVPVIVQIAKTDLPMGFVLSLAPGAIIEFPKGSEEQLDLLANNKQIGSGVAVKVGENFGIKIGCIGDLKERLSAMGPGGDDEASLAEAAAEALADQLLSGQI